MPAVGPDAPVPAALKEMSAKGLGCVAIVEADGRLLGIITDGDLRRTIASGRNPETVTAMMTANPIVVRPDALAGAVMQVMNDRKIMQAPVVEDGRLVGVVHMHDVLKAGLA